MDINVIIWMFTIGAAVAMGIMYYNIRFLGRLVRKLIEIDATSPESALTLEEIDIKLSPALKHSLRPGTNFSETVLRTEDGRYYIAPDKLSMAKSKYRGKDVNLVFILLSFVILLIFAYVLTLILPDIIEGASGQISDAFGGGKEL
ncbi:MAG: hypothetical protein IIX67_06560 [Clostridia bacterium]|jgi:hypothetical protein|nr:hypothetical protein [Clostridia bacterium]